MRIWLALGAACCGLVGLGVACGGGTSSRQAAPTPTVYATAQALPTGGLGVRLCRSADIEASAAAEAAGSTLLALITLGNRSDTPCQVPKLPDIQLLDAHDDVLPILVTPGQPCPAALACQRPLVLVSGLPPPAPDVATRPGQALLILNWQVRGKSGACPTRPARVTQVKLLLQEAGSAVSVDVTSALPGGINPCDRVFVASFGPGAG